MFLHYTLLHYLQMVQCFHCTICSSRRLLSFARRSNRSRALKKKVMGLVHLYETLRRSTASSFRWNFLRFQLCSLKFSSKMRRCCTEVRILRVGPHIRLVEHFQTFTQQKYTHTYSRHSCAITVLYSTYIL